MLLHLEMCLKRVNIVLKLIGLSIDSDDYNKTVLQRIRKHWIYCIHGVSFNLSVICEIMWLVRSLFVGCTLWEITYLMPCITLCFLGDLKVFFFIRHMHRVNELVNLLRTLQSKEKEDHEQLIGETKIWLTFLSTILKVLLMLIIFGAVAFALGPFFITGSHYVSTGEIKPVLPFIGWYPFNELEIHIWPIIYLTQLWGGEFVFHIFFSNMKFIYLRFIS